MSKFGGRFDIFGWKVGYWLRNLAGLVEFLYVFAVGLIYVLTSLVGFVCKHDVNYVKKFKKNYIFN